MYIGSMKLSKKDYLIIALVFVLTLSASTLGLYGMVFRDNTLHPLLMNNAVLGGLALFGYILIFPVMLMFMALIGLWQWMGIESLSDWVWFALPWISAFLYTAFFVFGLVIYTDRKKNRK